TPDQRFTNRVRSQLDTTAADTDPTVPRPASNRATSTGEMSAAPSARATAGRIRPPTKALRSARLKIWREYGGHVRVDRAGGVTKHASSSSSQHKDRS